MRRHSMVVATTARYYDVMTHIFTTALSTPHAVFESVCVECQAQSHM